ncbi:hypothetical protein PGUG_01810 [Meyerozyma guilliermondii ATCC 6260]|uniref:Plasma membrane proteolipid 3 n=1 Tax=Meyerozyma guilliermondii (strain ATCC 6260 / CBS 566 / DSM 6381 / JCM 1539 / NBRC 10279 / NRRL Y-324) TaxID=294746 RepID=A5DEV9_PICGU|nr:uncharacterized protein PGUG_01810 [Meyerozyma guilliermondii ATCC 6260]EDK37712.1 hypothetical protein PGUG_01810 [Meyerozyma guilliermondii ATCC 6260]
MCFCCCECMTDLCLIVLSVLFPPLPVWIRRGFCSQDSLINILLFILGYFPGLIHSWYIIAKYPPYTITQESKVYYIYRGNPDLENQLPPQNNCHHHHHHHNGPVVATEPTPLAPPSTSYGAINQEEPAPPAYTELDRPKGKK